MKSAIPKVLIIQHHAWEGSGIIGAYLRKINATADTTRLYKNAAIPFEKLESYSAVVSLGSTSTSYKPETNPHHNDEIELFRKIRRLRVPSFNICYSMQMFCLANGGVVSPNQKGKEVGFIDVHLTAKGKNDRVFSNLAPSYRTLEWHGDYVAKLPNGAVHLAFSEKTKNQAAVLDGIHYLIQSDGQAATLSNLKNYFKHDRKWAGLTSGEERLVLKEAAESKNYFHDCCSKIFGAFLELTRNRLG